MTVKDLKGLALVIQLWVLFGCSGGGSSDVQAQESTGKASGHAVYEFDYPSGVNALLVFDTEDNSFFCVTTFGGITLGEEGNFTMAISMTPPMITPTYDTVMINGEEKNRFRFLANAVTVTVNNNATGLPGDQTGEEPEVMFDELVPCSLVVEAVDDDEGGDRWRVEIYGSTLFPDGTTFQNFTGDDITMGTTTGLIAGDISITF